MKGEVPSIYPFVCPSTGDSLECSGCTSRGYRPKESVGASENSRKSGEKSCRWLQPDIMKQGSGSTTWAMTPAQRSRKALQRRQALCWKIGVKQQLTRSAAPLSLPGRPPLFVLWQRWRQETAFVSGLGTSAVLRTTHLSEDQMSILLPQQIHKHTQRDMEFQEFPEPIYTWGGGQWEGVPLGLWMRKYQDGDTFPLITSVLCPLKRVWNVWILENQKVELQQGREKWLPGPGVGNGEFGKRLQTFSYKKI